MSDKTSFTHERALEEALQYFEGKELPAQVWVEKYALRDTDGGFLETDPSQMHTRITEEIMRIEEGYPKTENSMNYSELYQRLSGFSDIVPQGSPMAGIGNRHQTVSLSNCFVIGHEEFVDSYGGIMLLDEEQIHLMKRRGGVGHDLSDIRPAGAHVNNAARSSTGLVAYMERYSNTTREVAQQGRRGALMLSVSVEHPDIEAFVDAKLDLTKVTGANVSVRVTDEFMEAVENGDDFRLRWPVGSNNPEITRVIDARTLYAKMMNNAWASAEPGVLFWDTIIRESTPDRYPGFKTVSTNPCGEIPLCPYDSCRLLALNLWSVVDNPFTPEATIMWEKLQRMVHYGMRCMDNIVDLEIEKIDAILEKIASDPEPDNIKARERSLWLKIKKKAVYGRRTGMGITGAGDMLAGLGLVYGSRKGNIQMEQVIKFIATEAFKASVDLAMERGHFPIFDAKKELDAPFVQRILQELDADYQAKYQLHGRRNIAMLTIAPTGSTSILTDTTSGIENLFLPYYTRRRKVNPGDTNARVDFVDDTGDSWQEYKIVHTPLTRFISLESGKTFDEIAQMSQEELDYWVKRSPYADALSTTVDWEGKVAMQGMVQKWIDHSISVTVNLPSDISVDEVSRLYMTAWISGCKGLTVYRDGSRTGVLTSGTKKEPETKIYETIAPKRPEALPAKVLHFMVGTEAWVAVVGLYEGSPYEIFTGPAKSAFQALRSVDEGQVVKVRTPDGSRYDFKFNDSDGYAVTIEGLSRVFNPEYWNYAKLVSGILRHGMPLPHVVSLVDNLSLDAESLHNWKAGVVRTLKTFIPEGTSGGTCPSCGEAALVFQEGCMTCTSCGHSKCG